jgi:predicted ATPase/signal transduction histidine kinase/CheY-like chemotaxis protein
MLEKDLSQKPARFVAKTAIVDSTDLNLLNDERLLAKRLTSRFVLEPLHLDHNTGHLYYEYFDSCSLEHLNASQPLSYEQQCSIAVELVHALQFFHQHNHLVTAFSSSHILVSSDTKQLKLFNLTGYLNQESSTLHQLHFIAPEQSDMIDAPVDHRSSFYSLGIILYQLVFGDYPFSANDANSLMYKHVATEPDLTLPVRSEVNPVYLQVIEKLLHKDSNQRYQSHNGLLKDLLFCLGLSRNQISKQQLAEFQVAEADQKSAFKLPQKIYGRDRELQQLIQLFHSARNHRPNLVMISGYSGIGKSSLINSLIPTVQKYHGLIIKGKCDQFKRNIPYSALLQASEKIIAHLLTLSAENINQWIQRLQKQLKDNLGVIAEFLPSLNKLIDISPAVPVLNAAEAEKRFQDSFVDFITCFATEKQPLVLCLDDLQWADTATFTLLEYLLTHAQQSNLLIIGAYRDNEITPDHAINRLLNKLAESNQSEYQQITLSPLTKQDVEQFIADTLHTIPGSISELTDHLFSRTEGNPFYLSTVTKSLYEEGIIYFDYDKNQWTWQSEVLATVQFADNVVELMVNKISILPKLTQNLLTDAALLGNQFSASLLSSICTISLTECERRLKPAVDEDLISLYEENSTSSYLFNHDRIQQAAASLLQLTELPKRQLAIGQKWLERDDNIFSLFDIIKLINAGRDFVKTNEEKVKFAHLNLVAGVKATNAYAFTPALEYLKAATQFLNTATNIDDHLHFSVYRELANAAYLAGDFTTADNCYPFLEKLGLTPLQIINFRTVQANQYQLQGKFKQVMSVISEAISLANIVFPNDITDINQQIDIEFELLEQHLLQNSDQQLLNTPVLQEPLLIGVMELMRIQWYASYLLGQAELNSLISLRMSRVSIEKGFCDTTAFAFVTSGLVSRSVKEDDETSKRLGQLAIRLAEQYDNKTIRGAVYLLYTTFIHHWYYPIHTSFSYFETAWQCSESTNDYVSAGYVINVRSTDSLIASHSLIQLETQYQQEIEYLKRVKQVDMEDATRAGGLQAVLALRGKTNSPETFSGDNFSETNFIKKYAETGLHQAYFYQAKIRHAFIMQTVDQLALAEKSAIVEQYVPGQAKVAETLFYTALIWLRHAENEHDDYFIKAQAIYTKYCKWESLCRHNFAHKRMLLDAEMARIRNDFSAATRYYEDAVEAAEKAGFANTAAVTSECYAIFAKQNELGKLCQSLINNAFFWYNHWGASAKTKQLQQVWFEYLLPQNVPSSAQLDVKTQGIFNALNTISKGAVEGEIYERLLNNVIKYSGATYVALVQLINDKLWLEASVSSQSGFVCSYSESLVKIEQDNQFVPENLIQFASKQTHQLYFESPSEWSELGFSDYLQHIKPMSIICQPLTSQDKTTHVLYLEHKRLTQAFNQKNIETIALLGQQAMITIENAALYKDMEKRINMRTQELAEATKLSKQANEAKSNFLARMSHEIRTPMNAIIGLSHLTLKSSLTAIQHKNLTHILNSSKNLLGLLNDILDFSKIEAGKLHIESISFSVEELIQQIISEHTLSSSEKGIELITHISSSVPHHLIGDPLRLKQVLSNLLTNAIKFTDKGSVSLVIDGQHLPHDQVDLDISVTDTGIGMTSEQQQTLFHSFSQVDDSVTRKYGGTGLGLAICKQLIELMGGKVYVNSTQGRGSTFNIKIKAKIDNNTEMAINSSDDSLNNLKVLLVDDLSLARNVVLDALQRFNMKIDQTSNGQKALELVKKAQQNNQQYDLIIMDWLMPVMDGVTAGKMIRDDLGINAPQIVMVSAYDKTHLIEQLPGDYGFQLIEKPISQTKLIDKLRDIFTPNTTPTEQQDSESVPDFSNYSLLIVDDNQVNTYVAMGLLTETDITIDTAENGQQALDKLSTQRYDIVLMDIQMPVMDGHTATRKARQQLKLKTPIIAMTANAMTSDIEKSRNAGMDAHLAKPINPDTLFKVLSGFLNSNKTINTDTRLSYSGNNELSRILSECAQLSQLEVTKALANLKNNQTLYETLLDDFANNPDVLVQLNNSVLSLNDEELFRFAHTVKSTCSYIGAYSLSEQAKQLETLSKNSQKREDINPLALDVEQSLTQLMDQIRQILDNNRSKNEQITFNYEHFIMHLKMLTDAVESSNVDAEQLSQDLYDICQNSPYAAICLEIKNALARLDFSAAKTKLAECKQQLTNRL